MNKKIGLLLPLVALGGCTGVAGMFGGHVNAYPGKERPVEEIAVLLPATAQLAKVDAKHVGDDLVSGYPSDVRVLPGERKLALDCREGLGPITRIEFTARFEAGHFYRLYCHPQGVGKYAGDMTDLGTRDPRGQ